jgi:hypothetical protein
MKKILLTAAAIVALSTGGLVAPSEAGPWRRTRYHAAHQAWHAPYARTGWQQPVALVVPPTAGHRTEFSWGIGGTTVTQNHHQFSPVVPMHGGNGQGFHPTPIHPSSTSQFGIYYMRAPW